MPKRRSLRYSAMTLFLKRGDSIHSCGSYRVPIGRRGGSSTDSSSIGTPSSEVFSCSSICFCCFRSFASIPTSSGGMGAFTWPQAGPSERHSITMMNRKFNLCFVPIPALLQGKVENPPILPLTKGARGIYLRSWFSICRNRLSTCFRAVPPTCFFRLMAPSAVRTFRTSAPNCDE